MITLCFGILIVMNIYFARNFLRKVRENVGMRDSEVEELLNSLILAMHSGRSFENSLQELLNERGDLERKLRVRGEKSSELALILGQCRKKPAQSLKILTSYRRICRFKARFHQKVKSASVQAKAQAVVSACIYIIVLGFQLMTNSDFCVFFATGFGRGLVFFSAILLGVGIFLVFGLAKPKVVNI